MKKATMLVAILVALLGCQNSQPERGTQNSKPAEPPEPAAQQAPQSRESMADVPTAPLDLPDEAYEYSASGLKYAILEHTEGVKAEPGHRVAVHYVLWLPDGRTLDSSYQRGKPFEFVLGKGQVIPGWEEGIALLHEGERAQLVVPPEMGYGSRGMGPVPPNATLVFYVHLVKVYP
ncbi:MAG: FKBP-type peptidyl-prolyl cis-trans isomerase [Calditrichaeota bacterium]|nr:MAG: FKBP-type peptidyl-prolyl cis-trans isomerase [Calditrichota bacterium]